MNTNTITLSIHTLNKKIFDLHELGFQRVNFFYDDGMMNLILVSYGSSMLVKCKCSVSGPSDCCSLQNGRV